MKGGQGRSVGDVFGVDLYHKHTSFIATPGVRLTMSINQHSTVLRYADSP